MQDQNHTRLSGWIRTISIATIAISNTVIPALAQAEWEPILDSPETGEFRQPDDPFRVVIPQEAPPTVVATLRLELDAIDVTPLVAYEGNTLSFRPVQPLAFGPHQLRVVQYTPEGEMLERAYWSFEVRQSALFREAVSSANPTLTFSNRVVDDKLIDPSERTQAQGALAVQSDIAGADWESAGSANFVYADGAAQMTDRAFDLSDFLITTSSKSAELRVGDHAPGGGSLILDGFYSRGISAGATSPGGILGASAFTMRTETITGFRDGLGITDPDNRTQGASVNVYPLASDPEKLSITASYLDGDGSGQDDFTLGDPFVSGGDAQSIAVDSRILDRQLRLRAEYAFTEFDFDGANQGFDAERESAYALYGVYRPPDRYIDEQPLTWSFGLTHQQVGPWFRSLGNSGLPTDKRMTAVSTEIAWSAWSGNLRLARENDNVEEDPARVEVATNVITAALNWSPFQEKPKTGIAALFSHPAVSMNVSESASEDVRLPAGAIPVDNLTREYSVFAAFRPKKWDWSVGHTTSLFDDFESTTSETRNDTTSLDARVPIASYLDVSPSLQHSVFEDRTFGLEATTLQASLAVTIHPSARWNATVAYSLNRNKASDDSMDTENQIVSAGMEWIALTPGETGPGLKLFVNGSYENNEDAVWPTANVNRYQVFAGITTSWPVRY